MYPYIDIGPLHLGTFGLLLWLAAVCATVVLHRNFVRNGVDADALSIVALVTLSGIIGAKLWHELQNPAELLDAWRRILLPGWHHPFDVAMAFLHWFQAGFAWFGGLLAGVAMLMYQGHLARPNGLAGHRAALRMLDLAAPAAAIGYGVGRIGCLTSGDGDYGIDTTLPWGVHIRPDALDPPRPDPAGLLVQPTPVYELLFALALGWWLWKRGSRPRPLGFLTGEYLVISGIGRFLVEFVRINPHVYGFMSNAQLAALVSVAFGAGMMLMTRNNYPAERSHNV
ncbi:MAG: prolipoprotein diacylglyceryl transferase [Acidobacteriota bacterium]|nr:prolipoprotein diacylglyceryl transferase [Acidobacteriota bacterium]